VGARGRQRPAQDVPARSGEGAALAIPGHGRAGDLGYLLTHYAISALICAAATAAGIDPDRVKFKRTMRIIRRAIGPAFPPDRATVLLAQITGDIARKKNLNPRRRRRTYPRAIKRGRHNAYRVKKPGDHSTRHDGPPTIRLANPVKSLVAA